MLFSEVLEFQSQLPDFISRRSWVVASGFIIFGGHEDVPVVRIVDIGLVLVSG